MVVKKIVINFSRRILVVVILLKVAFVFEVPQRDIFSIFAHEMSEVDSEESRETATDEDEFIELSCHWENSHQPFSSACMIFFIPDTEAHIREIVPPPPQV